MLYIIRDVVSDFYVAVDPTPNVPYLLREDSEHATTFKSRASALETLKIAQPILDSRYNNLELEVQLLGRKRTWKETLRSRSRRDVADSYNEVLTFNRRYGRDMA